MPPWQLVEAILLDPRVTSVRVTTPVVPEFLTVDRPERRRGQVITLEEPVIHAGQEIGRVIVDMDTGELESLLHGQWGRTIITGILQLVIGLGIMFAILKLKVLEPVTRLVRETEALADGNPAQPLDWPQADEIGALGRSFESARQKLQGLVNHLEERNHELAERESELQQQTQMLRNTLDNMTTGSPSSTSSFAWSLGTTASWKSWNCRSAWCAKAFRSRNLSVST